MNDNDQTNFPMMLSPSVVGLASLCILSRYPVPIPHPRVSKVRWRFVRWEGHGVTQVVGSSRGLTVNTPKYLQRNTFVLTNLVPVTISRFRGPGERDDLQSPPQLSKLGTRKTVVGGRISIDPLGSVVRRVISCFL